jgi:predicted secreted Zn-dependent protease
MLDLIPGLNVLDDPKIEQVRKMIAESLGGVDAKTIRNDGALRSQLAGEAGKIMSTMEGFMKAFGAGNS